MALTGDAGAMSSHRPAELGMVDAVVGADGLRAELEQRIRRLLSE